MAVAEPKVSKVSRSRHLATAATAREIQEHVGAGEKQIQKVRELLHRKGILVRTREP